MKREEKIFDRYRITLSLLYAKVPFINIPNIVDDFCSDSYWDDPKEIHRRIVAEGGDSERYFEFMKEHFNVEFDYEG